MPCVFCFFLFSPRVLPPLVCGCICASNFFGKPVFFCFWLGSVRLCAREPGFVCVSVYLPATFLVSPFFVFGCCPFDCVRGSLDSSVCLLSTWHPPVSVSRGKFSACVWVRFIFSSLVCFYRSPRNVKSSLVFLHLPFACTGTRGMVLCVARHGSSRFYRFTRPVFSPK